MNGLIQLLILYLIFMAIGSLVKRSKSRSGSQPKGKEPVPQNLQAKLEGYFDKIEDYFREKKPSEISSQQLLRKPERLTISQPQRLELYPEKTQPQERSLPELQLDLSSEPKQLNEIQVAKVVKDVPYKPSSILSFDKRRGYLQGIILSEILGPPISKRRRRRFP
jgi:hypothetical protein